MHPYYNGIKVDISTAYAASSIITVSNLSSLYVNIFDPVDDNVPNIIFA